MKAIAYIRMASIEQANHFEVGNFPQEKTIKNYCYINDITLLKTFYDIAVSGLDFQRKGWSEMEQFLKGTKVDQLFVTDYDRIGRNGRLVLTKIAEIEEKHNTQILALANPRLPSTEEIEKLFKQ
ncbi:MAG: recombinase family protein [Chryseobacterium sp.]|nr:MAG: recombinase family protein [Chryseobacterium sp.]